MVNMTNEALLLALSKLKPNEIERILSEARVTRSSTAQAQAQTQASETKEAFIKRHIALRFAQNESIYHACCTLYEPSASWDGWGYETSDFFLDENKKPCIRIRLANYNGFFIELKLELTLDKSLTYSWEHKNRT